MAKDEAHCLEILKKDYQGFQEKYNLPSFDKLNKDFQIEKAAEIETDYLLREIRKFIAEKFSDYLKFIESILHPINVPIFVFSFIRTLRVEEKNKLMEVYKELAKREIEIIELDIDFDEEKEAKFINESHKLWQSIKKDILDVLNRIKNNWDNKFEVNNKGYFG